MLLKEKKLNLTKVFVKQQDQSDCGVACLASIVAYFGGNTSLDRLRSSSGTSTQGTTMLGLYQAAKQYGLDAEGFEADAENLKEIEHPVILHLLIDGQLHHYVVCYGWKKSETIPNDGYFLIGDPAKGLVQYSEVDLLSQWKSKALLKFTPNGDFVSVKEVKKGKQRWFIDLVRDDLSVLGLGAIIGILVAVLGLSTAIFTQKLVDKILPASDIKKLLYGTLLLGVLLMARNGLTYLRGLLTLKQSFDLNIRLSNQFIGRILRLPKHFFDSRKIGDLVARLNDVRRIQATVSNLTGSIVIDALIVIATAGFTMVYHLPIGLFMLLSVPLYVLLTALYNTTIVDTQREAMVSYAKNESKYLDTIQGISIIKSSNKESFFEKSSLYVYSSFQTRVADLGKLILRFNLYSDTINTILTFIIIAWTSWLVLHKSLQLGEMIAILTMASTFIPSVGRLATVNFQIQEAIIAFDRMFEFTSIDPEYTVAPLEEAKQKPVSSPPFTRLVLKNVSFRFPGRGNLLNSINLELGKGQIVSLLGESGCGKSTIMQILQRFYSIGSGEIIYNNNDWNNISTVDWRDRIGVVPQDIYLFSGTVLDNIVFGAYPAQPAEVVEFCQQHGFSSFFESLPQGYMTILGDSGVNISGGQKQLIALARALFRRPQLLLLDEATSALDRNTERFVMNLLLKLRSQLGISVLLVTHRVQIARLTDYTYVLNNGMVVAQGAHEELLLQESMYKDSWMDMGSLWSLN